MRRDQEDDEEDYAGSILNIMKSHFGDSVKSYWVYPGELCPCCLTRPIDLFTFKSQPSLSINGFMYRDKGVLIGYLLCGECAQVIMAKAKFGPTALHTAIEENLKNAYRRHLASLDA